ncbi:Eaa protein [Salmonella enterica]|uniref:Eaa protein n=1 Tax=Salmonella enterica TaxID=28901 RepID=A0A749L156_SALER|nr:Eaa protein [Salmonella enterica]HAF5757884.1 Eaa protein [Salmonella enterica]
MTTITKERIELFVKSPLENGLTRGEQMELARIALASLEAEPIGYMNCFTGRVFSLDEQPGADTDTTVYEPVYAAPPVPVVPEEITDESTEQRLMGRRWAHSFCAGWNACRAAMLSGGKS